jgi:hypothetical protein
MSNFFDKLDKVLDLLDRVLGLVDHFNDIKKSKKED